MTNKEFLIIDGTLMVRELQEVASTYAITGSPKGSGIAVTMRPATLQEVAEYADRINRRSQ